MFKTVPGDGSTSSMLPVAKEESKNRPKEHKQVFCGYCHHAVSDPEQQTQRSGAHTHLFANPNGMVFEIGCYKRAQGCYAAMDPTSEFTWFSGYQWQLSICRSCHRHLGWFFSSKEDSFFGLILDHLIIS